MRFREVFERMHREAEEWLSLLCGMGYTVVLFGSRAKGTARIDSDWDVLIIGGRPPEPPHDLIDARSYTDREVEERIADFDTVVIDALLEGKLICGDRKRFEELRSEALRRVEGYVKTEVGWVRRARRI